MMNFDKGAVSYFLINMSYFLHFMEVIREWGKLNISVRKSVAFLFFRACYFCANKKRNEYDEKDWKIKRMADVAS